MKIILYKGYKTLIDREDYKWLNQYRWHLDSHGYAEHSKLKRMHRLIIKAKKGEYVDHINGNKLDNRRENLRICTNQQNASNRVKSKNNISGYKGVYYLKAKCFDNRIKRWVASVECNYAKHCKYYLTKKEAIIGYNELALKYFGEFAKLNKI